MRGRLVFCFWLSGASALVYEVVWNRMLGWMVGTSVAAVATTITAFMVGLALGGILGGRFIDRWPRVFRAYAIIEAAVAVTGALITLVLPHLAPWSGHLEALTPTALQPLVRFGLVFMLLVVPTILMGATLPILGRALTEEGTPAGVIGLLYAINTLGAVVGVLSADLALVPTLGVTATGLVASAGNLVAAAVAWTIPSPAQRPSPPASAPDLRPGYAVLACFAVSGACSLACEVLWTRMLLYFLGSSIFSFTVILVVFLAGLAIGSWLIQGTAARHPHPIRLLATLQLFLALLVGLSLPTLAWLPTLNALMHGTSLNAWVVQHMLLVAIPLLLPTIVMGACFPLYIRIGARGSVGTAVGSLVAANTLGAAAGSLAAGAALLPLLGLQRAIVAVALTYVALAAAVWMLEQLSWKRLVLAGCVLLTLGVPGLVALPADYVLQHTLSAMWPGQILFFHDAPEASTAVMDVKDFDGTPFRSLITNGYSMTATNAKSRRYTQLLGQLPLLLHPAPRRAMVICLGTGMTLSAVAAHEELTHIQCVELSPTVRQVLPMFEDANHRVWEDPRVDIAIDDGRHYLLTHPETYDVITFEPPPPVNAGVVNLYSRDFYALCHARLAPGGTLSQWLPVPQMTPEDVRRCIRAFVEVFPDATLWSQFGIMDLCLVGSKGPVTLSPQRLRERMRGQAAALEKIGVSGPEDLLGTFLLGPERLAEYVRDTPPLVDDHPWIEYDFTPSSVTDVDYDALFRNREPVANRLADAPDPVALARAEGLNDAIYRYNSWYCFPKTPRWVMDRDAQKVAAMDRQSLYARALLGIGDEARQVLDDVLKRTPRNVEALLSRGRWRWLRGDLEGARTDFRAALAEVPDAPYILYSLGVVEAEVGRATVAADCFRQVLAQGPDLEFRDEVEGRLKRALMPAPGNPTSPPSR